MGLSVDFLGARTGFQKSEARYIRRARNEQGYATVRAATHTQHSWVQAPAAPSLRRVRRNLNLCGRPVKWFPTLHFHRPPCEKPH